ncbi:MAG: hypothetical protein MJY71_01900 [Bacteroidaceae bacterium]|nr:hypothetical protein [Bacteroidaceae bacterium]
MKIRHSAIISLIFLFCSCSVFRNVNSPIYRAGEPIADDTYSPEGIIEETLYSSSEKKLTQRRMIVYLPGDYYSTDKHYPVLYLLHGARGYETSWIKKGNILKLTDQLWNQDKAREYILVMPNMNQYRNDRDCDSSRIKGALESIFEVNGAVEHYFTDDVVHFVDSCYRTIPDKRHRAIAGLSIGGLQSIYISADQPEMFDYIGLFSPYKKNFKPFGYYQKFYKSLKNKQTVQFENAPKEYFIGIGKADIFYGTMKKYRRYLDRNHYPYEYMETLGGHDWYNWVEYYKVFMTRCF